MEKRSRDNRFLTQNPVPIKRKYLGKIHLFQDYMDYEPVSFEIHPRRIGTINDLFLPPLYGWRQRSFCVTIQKKKVKSSLCSYNIIIQRNNKGIQHKHDKSTVCCLPQCTITHKFTMFERVDYHYYFFFCLFIHSFIYILSLFVFHSLFITCHSHICCLRYPYLVPISMF